jgi:hypothetical protein
MSYDIWATIEPAPGRFSTHLDLGNMTSNVAPMWRKACPELDGLAGIHGKTGAEISEQLATGLRAMFWQRRKLERIAPSNGWGDYPSAFRYFAAVTRAAQDHPPATFHVDR